MIVRLSNRNRRACRGMFLIEAVAYMAILGVALLLLSDVFMMLMQVTKETANREVLISRVDTVLDMLRRDAWSATEMHAREAGATGPETSASQPAVGHMDGRVEMREPGGTIVWQMGDDGVLTRSDGGTGPGHSWSWKDMPKVHFSVQGAVLVVQVDSGPNGNKHEQVALISQRMAGGRI
jgi:type II secretory pathway pseudopilin PulG